MVRVGQRLTLRAVALVTGASGGIGAELARVLAEHGHDLALVARRRDALDGLATELVAAGRPRPLAIAADLAAPDGVAQVIAALAAADARVAILVNNAGYGLLGEVAALDPAGQLGIVDLNIRALLDLTLRLLPDLCAAQGKILNVGSVASFMPGPGMAVYYASKAFVSAFSRALTEELKAARVSVSVLHPGVTATGFHRRAGLPAATAKGVTARSVAEAGYAGLMAGKRMIVPGLGNKAGALLLPLMPDALLLPLVHRFQRGRR